MQYESADESQQILLMKISRELVSLVKIKFEEAKEINPFSPKISIDDSDILKFLTTHHDCIMRNAHWFLDTFINEYRSNPFTVVYRYVVQQDPDMLDLLDLQLFSSISFDVINDKKDIPGVNSEILIGKYRIINSVIQPDIERLKKYATQIA